MSPSVANREFLVILHRDSAPEALAALSARFRVTQAASPRMVVVETGPGQHPPSVSLPGVLAVTDGWLDPEVAETFDETERLFATAWTSRMTGPPKHRRGDGLSWDAQGFAPPDPPADRPSTGLSL